MHTIYKVTWTFLEKLCGSVPLNPDMIRPWLENRFKKHQVRPPGSMSMEEVTEEVMNTLAAPPFDEEKVEEAEKQSTLGFQTLNETMSKHYKTPVGLVMRGGTIKAHLKDCARILSRIQGKVEGDVALDWKIMNCTNVKEYLVPILRDGKPVQEPDDFFDKAVHAKVFQKGKGLVTINCLKRICYVDRPTMVFHLKVLTTSKGPVINAVDLAMLMNYSGPDHGYAGERGDGEGRYIAQVEEIKDDSLTQYEIKVSAAKADKEMKRMVKKHREETKFMDDLRKRGLTKEQMVEAINAKGYGLVDIGTNGGKR